MDISAIRRTNLKLIIEERFGGIAAELARLLGRQPSEISRIFTTNPAHLRNIGAKFAREVEVALGKDLGWMDKLQTTTLAGAAPAYITEVTQVNLGVRLRVPLISAVHAGEGQAFNHRTFSSTKPEDWVLTTAAVSERSYALRIVGDSMEPKFPEGGIIIVDPEAEARNASFVVARFTDSGETTFKQLIIDGKRYLKPLNPRYPIIEINGSTTICGVVKQLLMSFD